jgi:hypothetical protein
MKVTANLRQEITRRVAEGYEQITPREFDQRLRAIGYKLDRKMDCPCTARILTGDHSGKEYPCTTTSAICLADNLGYSHVDCKQPNFEAFK